MCYDLRGGKGRGDWEWDVIRVVGQMLKSETINELVVALFGSFVTTNDGCKEINRGAGQVATRTQGGTEWSWLSSDQVAIRVDTFQSVEKFNIHNT